MDVENLDALNPAELDELLERALNPQVPVELLYAVLDRIGPATDTKAVKAPTASMSSDVEATTVIPPVTIVQPTRGAATDRAVRPERPKQTAQQQAAGNSKQQSSTLKSQAPTSQNPLSSTGQNPSSATSQQPQASSQKQPKPASPASHPSLGAHAPARRVSPPPADGAK